MQHKGHWILHSNANNKKEKQLKSALNKNKHWHLFFIYQKNNYSDIMGIISKEIIMCNIFE